MAILKMKKLNLAVVKSEKQELLRKLSILGCVQIDEMDNALEGVSLAHETSNYIELKTTHTQLLSAIELLKSAVKEKGGLLSAKPEYSREEILDDAGIAEAVEKAQAIISADDEIKRSRSDESRARADIESLKPWLSLDLPLSVKGTKTADINLGSIPVKTNFADMESAVAQASEEAEVFVVSEDKASKYIAVVSAKQDTDAVNEALRSFGYNMVNISDFDGTPGQSYDDLNAKLEGFAKLRDEKQAFIEESAAYRDEIKYAADKIAARMAMEEASEKIVSSEQVLYLQGWIPAEKVEALDETLNSFSAAYEVSDPTEDEVEDVPVSLKNNKVTNALNMVTNMYSLPQYGTVDPNPWMAPFFILFYGLMMADMGYGLIMIISGIVALKKMKPRDNSLSFCQLLLYCGISTFICGALTGGFFSDVLYQLFGIELPALFSPVRDSETVLYGSLVLGFIQLIVGMVCSFIQKLKAGEIASAIWEEGSLWVLFIGAGLAFFGIGSINGLPVPLFVGLAMLLFGAGREAKGFGKVTAAFGCIYNTSTGWFGDVLSYSRIMALMLAGGVVGQVFNTVAVMPMKGADGTLQPSVVTIIAFIVIFVLGHLMNFALNLLGCYVHDLRLQCLEYFGKFYTDGGKPFTPLDIKGKFINPKNN